ncbi:MAG: hypothetical protein ACM3XN_09145 [Chloroflexota bacterium]
MARDDELVLVVDRDRLFCGDAFSGVQTTALEPFYERIAAAYRFMRRGDAERDETVKQLIPYCVIRQGERVFLTQRLRTQTEARLHNLYSVGIGGHMNGNGTAPLAELIRLNLERELAEEVAIGTIEAIDLIGAINDDSTSVSRCHFGLLYEVWTGGDVTVRETDKMVGRFVRLADIRPGSDIYLGMEDWSRHAVDTLIQRAAETAATAET